MYYLFLALCFIYTSEAQLVSSYGSFYSNKDYSITQCVGDISVKLSYSGDYIIGQGYLYSEEGDLSDIVNDIILNCKIYPTPCKEYLYLITYNEIIKKDYEIIDISGNTLLKGKIQQNDFKIDVSKLNSGIYFLKIKSKYGYNIKKILIYK